MEWQNHNGHHIQYLLPWMWYPDLAGQGAHGVMTPKQHDPMVSSGHLGRKPLANEGSAPTEMKCFKIKTTKITICTSTHN